MGGTNQPKLEVYDWVCHIIINIFVMFILCHTYIWLGIPWPLFPVPSAIWAGRRPVERAETNALTSPKYYFVPFKYVDHLSYHLFLPKRCPHSNGKKHRHHLPRFIFGCFWVDLSSKAPGCSQKRPPVPSVARLLHLCLYGLGAFVQLRELGLELVLCWEDVLMW